MDRILYCERNVSMKDVDVILTVELDTLFNNNN